MTYKSLGNHVKFNESDFQACIRCKHAYFPSHEVNCGQKPPYPWGEDTNIPGKVMLLGCSKFEYNGLPMHQDAYELLVRNRKKLADWINALTSYTLNFLKTGHFRELVDDSVELISEKDLGTSVLLQVPKEKLISNLTIEDIVGIFGEKNELGAHFDLEKFLKEHKK